jgi:UDP-glucose 4-epimerase
MRVLVIGGNGFIGSHVVDELLGNGCQVRIFDRMMEKFRVPLAGVDYRIYDFKDNVAVAEALVGIDVVVHLLSSTVPRTSNIDPVGDIQDNLIGTVNLLQAMKQEGVSRIVYLSSGGTVYGYPQFDPIPETHPLNPICSYGVVKVAIEKYLLMYKHLYHIRPLILRPSNPYGERQGHTGVQGVIGTFLSNILNGDPVEVWGDGSVVRDFIYIKDLAALCRLAVQKEISGVFNAGMGAGYSIRKVTDVIREVTGMNFELKFREARSYDVLKSVLDTTAVSREFQWKPQVGLNEGVERTFNWLKNIR